MVRFTTLKAIDVESSIVFLLGGGGGGANGIISQQVTSCAVGGDMCS